MALVLNKLTWLASLPREFVAFANLTGLLTNPSLAREQRRCRGQGPAWQLSSFRLQKTLPFFHAKGWARELTLFWQVHPAARISLYASPASYSLLRLLYLPVVCSDPETSVHGIFRTPSPKSCWRQLASKKQYFIFKIYKIISWIVKECHEVFLVLGMETAEEVHMCTLLPLKLLQDHHKPAIWRLFTRVGSNQENTVWFKACPGVNHELSQNFSSQIGTVRSFICSFIQAQSGLQYIK